MFLFDTRALFTFHTCNSGYSEYTPDTQSIFRVPHLKINQKYTEKPCIFRVILEYVSAGTLAVSKEVAHVTIYAKLAI